MPRDEKRARQRNLVQLVEAMTTFSLPRGFYEPPDEPDPEVDERDPDEVPMSRHKWPFLGRRIK